MFEWFKTVTVLYHSMYNYTFVVGELQPRAKSKQVAICKMEPPAERSDIYATHEQQNVKDRCVVNHCVSVVL